MADITPNFFFIRQGMRVSGPFTPQKLADMERAGRLDVNAEWSSNKVQWQALATLPWKEQPAVIFEPSAPLADSAIYQVSNEMNNPDPPSARLRLGRVQLEEQYKSDMQDETQFTPDDTGETSSAPCSETTCCSTGEFLGTISSLLWQPADGFNVIHQRWGDSTALRAGLTMMAMAAGLILFIIFQCLPQINNNSAGSLPPFIKVALGVCTPIASLFVCCMLCRTIFGNKRCGGVGGDALMAGGFAWFAVITIAALLAVVKLASYGAMDSNSMTTIAISIAILSYGITCITVSMFNGLTVISGVPRSSACWVLAAIGSGSCVLTYCLIKMFFQTTQ